MTRADRPETSADQSLWHMIVAPVIWAVHFTLCYAVTAIWCERIGGDFADLRLILGGVTAVALGVIAVLGVLSWRRWDYLDDRDYVHDQATDEHRREFLGHAGFLLACLSFVAVLYVSLPILLIGTCR